MSELDRMLYRPLKDGKQFDKHIPRVTCERTDLGDGMTDYSVQKMAEMVQQYAYQMQAVAPLLKQRTLQRTCNAIHSFAYNHFQYKADTEEQILRSPACSWYTRRDGIDCKSYSIIVSAILVNLGIKHNIRRVKQPGFNPDLWTHVYVIVPADQTNGKLANGYYVVDGTVPTVDEGMFLEKDDLYMIHTGLNGARQRGLQAAVTIDTIKSFINGGASLTCIGGTLDANDFNDTLKIFVPWFESMFTQINTAVANNDPQLITLVNRLMTSAELIMLQSASYAKYNWSSSCSKSAAKAYGELGLYYYNIVSKAFLVWLENYFDVSYKKVDGLKRGGFEPASKFEKTKSFNGGTVSVTNVQGLKMKLSTRDVVKFEVTPYVASSTTSTTVDPLSLFNGLKTVIASFGTKTTTTTPTENGPIKTVYDGAAPGGNLDSVKYVLDPNTGQFIAEKNNVQQAGFGIVGWVLIAAGVGLAAKTVMDTQKGSKKTTSGTSAASKARATAKRRKA